MSDTQTTETTETSEPTIQDAVKELQKVVSHNAQVTMQQYDNAINGIRLNNLLLNAIIRKVGLSAEAVKDECEKIREEIEAQAKEQQEAQQESQETQDTESQELSMQGEGGEHPEGAIVFGD